MSELLCVSPLWSSIPQSEAITELDGELRFGTVLCDGGILPVISDVARRQPDQLGGGLIVGEMALVSDRLVQRDIQAFDGIGRVYNICESPRQMDIREVRAQVSGTAIPTDNHQGIRVLVINVGNWLDLVLAHELDTAVAPPDLEV